MRKCEFVAGARRRANSVCVRLGVFMCEGEEEEGEEVRGRCAFVYGCADVCVWCACTLTPAFVLAWARLHRGERI